MIRIEKEGSGELRREGVAELTNSLLAAKIETFTNGSIDIKEKDDGVEALLKVEGGELQISLSPESTTLSFSKGKVTKTCKVDFPVVEVQLRGPFLLFKLRDGNSVRAVREYNSISIEHFDFVPNLV